MRVDFDVSAYGRVLGVHKPLRLPFSAPVGSKVQVNARNVDLQLALLVEAQTGSGRSIFENTVDVSVNSLCNSRSEFELI
jgi:hypothetical protein